MRDQNFVDKVKKYFSFLETDYRFKLIVANNSDVHPQTDGVVKYASNTTLLLIDSEAAHAAVRFVRTQDDERYYLDPVSIHEFLNTSEQEKQILLSRDAKDKDAANVIFNKSFLLLSPEWKSSQENVYLDLESQLKNYAKWLKENAELCLIGDFSRWPNLYEYKINRLLADELRKGGKETVLSVIRDENGALKTIKRPMFQKERDHLARLRKEVKGK